MSYIIKNINPLDLQPSKGIGINIPFDGPTGLNITYNTKDAIRTNLLNFLLTGTRERILNPNFGSNIRNQIFEQISENSLNNIEDIIYTYIKDKFPQIKLEELIITPDNNTISIYIKYSVLNTNINDDIQLNFDKNDR
jgi:phage baseplate assembly protein W